MSKEQMYTFKEVGRSVVLHTLLTALLSVFSPLVALGYTALLLGLFIFLKEPIFK